VEVFMKVTPVRWFVLGLAFALVGPTSGSAQSLAEAARREKERQKQYQAAKVRSYTSQDLERVREKALISTVGAPSAPAGSVETVPTPTPARTAEGPAPPDVEKEIKRKQAEIQKLRAELANLETQINPSMALYRATDFGTLVQRKREVEARIQTLEKEIQALREKSGGSAGGPH
jgi:cell division septum initiation protein DivIVA